MNTIFSATLKGIDASFIEIESDISFGLIGFNIVGLPDNAVREAKTRIMNSIKHSNITLPLKKIILNLAPANMKKDGSTFDLPMALAVLNGFGILNTENAKRYLIAGELSLFGEIRAIHGAIAISILAKEKGLAGVILPHQNAREAALIPGVKVYGVSTLKEVVDFINKEKNLEVIKSDASIALKKFNFDFNEIRGQYLAKRAMEIVAAGHHNIAMIGAPGSGKTMIARRLPSILSPLTYEEMIETIKIYSAATLLKKGLENMFQRPFRAPHHSISIPGLVGGSSNPRPGEVSLAHNGVLFLDELTEFNKKTLEVLRQPLEDREVTITRATTSVTFPASTIFVSAMNPCPCGFYGDAHHACSCSHNEIRKYQKKISGPLLDRIDLIINVSSVKADELTGKSSSESSEKIRERVILATNIQKRRYKNESFNFNAMMTPKAIKKNCQIDEQSKKFLNFAIKKFNISARRYNRILKIARTIADLENSKNIEQNHISEAVNFNIQSVLLP